MDSTGPTWFRRLGDDSAFQRVTAYRPGPDGHTSSANTNVRSETVAEEADRGIAAIEAFLADSVLALA